MFIAVLFTVAKIWNQFRCPSVDEWKGNVVRQDHGILFNLNKKILSFRTAQLTAGDIILSEISQAQNPSNDISHIDVDSKKVMCRNVEQQLRGGGCRNDQRIKNSIVQKE